MFLCLDSDAAGSEACFRLAQDIPSRKVIAETITLRELPTAQPVPMLRMADVELCLLYTSNLFLIHFLSLADCVKQKDK